MKFHPKTEFFSVIFWGEIHFALLLFLPRVKAPKQPLLAAAFGALTVRRPFAEQALFAAFAAMSILCDIF